MFLLRLCPRSDKYQNEIGNYVTNLKKDIAISNSTILVHSLMLGVKYLDIILLSNSSELSFLTVNFLHNCHLHV